MIQLSRRSGFLFSYWLWMLTQLFAMNHGDTAHGLVLMSMRIWLELVNAVHRSLFILKKNWLMNEFLYCLGHLTDVRGSGALVNDDNNELADGPSALRIDSHRRGTCILQRRLWYSESAAKVLSTVVARLALVVASLVALSVEIALVVARVVAMLVKVVDVVAGVVALQVELTDVVARVVAMLVKKGRHCSRCSSIASWTSRRCSRCSSIICWTSKCCSRCSSIYYLSSRVTTNYRSECQLISDFSSSLSSKLNCATIVCYYLLLNQK